MVRRYFGSIIYIKVLIIKSGHSFFYGVRFTFSLWATFYFINMIFFKGCQEDMFSCDDSDDDESTGACLPLEKRCDSIRDCRNGKDEVDCNLISDSRHISEVSRVIFILVAGLVTIRYLHFIKPHTRF